MAGFSVIGDMQNVVTQQWSFAGTVNTTLSVPDLVQKATRVYGCRLAAGVVGATASLFKVWVDDVEVGELTLPGDAAFARSLPFEYNECYADSLIVVGFESVGAGLARVSAYVDYT